MEMEKEELGRYFLAIVRIGMGWLLLWSFFDKVFGLGFSTPAGGGWIDGVSPSSYISYVASGPLADFYISLGGNVFVDILMMAGLLCIGGTLIFGFASKICTAAFIAFMLIMFSLQLPPNDNPIINYKVLLAVAMLAIYYMGGFEKLSIYNWYKELAIVRRFPILE